MRDPKRIDKVLGIVRGIWHQFPDMRLGQLLENAVGTNKDLFYIEDDQLVEGLTTLSSIYNPQYQKGK